MATAALQGLDIGASAVKAVELERTKKGLRLLHMARLETPRPAEGEAPEAVPGFAALRDGEILSHPHVVMTCLSSEATVDFFNLPLLPDKELERSVRAEVAQAHEILEPEIVLSWQPVGPALPAQVGREAQRRIMAVFAPRATVEETIRSCRAAGLRLDALDARELALAETLFANYDFEPGEPAVALDLGYARSFLVAAVDGELRFSRRMRTAARDLFALMAESFGGGGFDPADLVRQCKIVPKSDTAAQDRTMLSMVADTFAEQILTEINHALDFGLLSLSDDRAVGDLKRLYLSGGLAKLDGLAPFLAGELKIEVEVLDPLRKIDFDFEILDRLQTDQVPEMAVPMGLALRKVQAT